ncbi:hypothetical protein [Xanthomonas sp. NCPPB 1128]|uniref:hypothetical protein n=1 Tax=Xanthomonas sp. NCPPB 1128 TaxID=1775876 RepID=UPI000A81F23E|nr:hypothetical protein [Xanthomonas sp. NCPPB 1128]
MTAPAPVDVRPPSLRGKELADMTAVELQAVVYAQRAAMTELIAASRDAAAVLQSKAAPGEQETPRRLYAALARVGGAP